MSKPPYYKALRANFNLESLKQVRNESATEIKVKLDLYSESSA